MKTQEEIEQLAKEVHYESQNQGLNADGCFNQYQGYIKGYTQCQEDMADVITNNNKEWAKQCAEITKELEEVRESYIKHTIGCEIWKGSKLLLLEKVKKENERLLDKINKIDYIVDREVFDTESNEFKIWEILNKQD